MRQCYMDIGKLTASRRAVLAGAATLVLPPWRAGYVDGAVRRRIRFGENPFQLGVASGDPTPDGMVLWTRLAPQPLVGGGMPRELVEVGWQIARDEGFQQIIQEGTTVATPQLAHSVHVEVSGLKPDRWYWYRFRVAGEESPVGRTRTFPEHGAMAQRLRFAFASCQHYETGFYTAYQHMANEDLDLGIHLGDYIYEGAGRENLIRRHVGEEITSLQDYRNRYAQYKTDVDLQAAHANFPWLVTWDDHEFDNNCASQISEESGIDVMSFLARRANAYQAYYEHMPLRRAAVPLGPDMKLYRAVPFGKLITFFVMDTRQYRSDQPNGDGNKPLQGAVFDPNATILGARQEGWLASGLLRSTAQWNVLAQQVMMARVDRDPSDEVAWSVDQWSGYDLARKRLLTFLAESQILNPVVLTGDIHSNWVNDLKVDFDQENDAVVATEFVGTSISSGGNGSKTRSDTLGVLRDNSFVRFFNNERGYVRCTVTPKRWQSDFRVVDTVTSRDSNCLTRASYAVEAGHAGAERM